ncbi:MAG: glycosyl hydrolase 53 family protein [Actinomycetota bacterium]|nr:glycosyl hydrolase 53 family protein [Actinomycetota bacterium]MDP2287903.1 glycosyl hydrolase 53 family protein [Actinomycetota bacterium]
MRISKKFAVGAATLALIASGIAPAAHAADVVVPGAEYSLGLAPEVTGSPGVAAAYIRLWDMGMAWRDINPSPGVFTFTVMDQRIAQAEAAGAKPLVVLGLTPTWAAANPSAGDPRWGAGTASAPSNPDTYTAYVTAIMQRYGARIGAVEVWNEANLQTFWTGTPAEMADLTARAYKAIKSISPNTQVIAASTTTRLASSVATFFAPYAAALKSAGYPFDAWTIHTYPAGNQGPADRYQDVLEWRGVLIEATQNDQAALNKQVWDTEVNYGLAGPGPTPHSDFDANTSGQFVARTFVDSVRLGIDATFWYMWTATSYSLLGVQMFNGTTTTIGAYNTTRAWLSGATLKGCDDLNGVIRCYFTGSGGAFYLAMSANDGAASLTKPPTATAENWLGQPVNTSGPVSLASGPVKFTCLPADTAQCTLGATPNAAAVPLPGSGPAITRTITIKVAKGSVNGKPGLVITGQSTGMPGEIVTSFWKQGAQKKFTAGNKATVQADGSFTVGKVTKGAGSAYVTNFGVKSNTASS